MPQTDQVISFIDKLGFFYEIVDENNQPILKATKKAQYTNGGIANGSATPNGDLPSLSNGHHQTNGYDIESEQGQGDYRGWEVGYSKRERVRGEGRKESIQHPYNSKGHHKRSKRV